MTLGQTLGLSISGLSKSDNFRSYDARSLNALSYKYCIFQSAIAATVMRKMAGDSLMISNPIFFT